MATQLLAIAPRHLGCVRFADAVWRTRRGKSLASTRALPRAWRHTRLRVCVGTAGTDTELAARPHDLRSRSDRARLQRNNEWTRCGGQVEHLRVRDRRQYRASAFAVRDGRSLYAPRR